MNSKENQLLKNTIIVAVGKICTQFMSFFLLPLYTAVLTAKEYGTVDLLNTYVSLLIPLFFFQMDQAIFRFLIDVRENELEKRKYISTAIITIFMQIILFLVIYLSVANFINNDFKCFLATNVVTSMLSNLFLQISRGLGDNSIYSQGSLISGASTILLNVLFIVGFKWGAYGMLSATLIANILCIIFVFIKKRLYKYIFIKNYNFNTIKELWKYSMPLIPNQLSWWVINASDRTIVTKCLGIGFNGVYSAANKFSSICITVFNIFNLTWSESASMYINDKDKNEYFSNVINTSLKLFSSICLIVIVAMPFIFKFLITGKEFSGAYLQIPILMLSTVFNIIVALLGSVYVALKKSKAIAKTSIYAAVINILINLLLIKYIGLFAASISTLISYIAMSIYRYVDVQKYVKIKFDIKYMIYFLILTILILITYYINNFLLNIISLFIACVSSIILNKNLISSIINFIKNKFLIKRAF